MIPKYFSFNFLIILLGTIIQNAVGSRVLELSDRFIDVRHEGQWFVMFYAPWCSHCKRTEPVWAHVAQSLVNTNVRVAKIDCTRFTAVGKHFNVQSYPTIMFIKGHQEYIYNGERSKDEMLPYAIRMSGPAVQQVTRVESFDMLKTQNEIFFTYVGTQNGILWETFLTAAERFQPHMYFYATTEPVANKHFLVDAVPTILVYKERNHFFFPFAEVHTSFDPSYLNETLQQWISEERFIVFPKITRSNIHHLSQTKKYLVVAVVEENRLSEIASHELEFRDLIESIIRQNYDKYHSKFQFGWIGSPDIAHSIIMDQLPTPHLLVLNSTTYEHHLPDDDPLRLTADAIHLFLQSIYHQKAPVLGGNSITVRLYRVYFETKRYLNGMWRGNPVLTCVLFGLPLGFLVLIVYTNCCGDFMVVEDDDEEDQDVHEKNE